MGDQIYDDALPSFSDHLDAYLETVDRCPDDLSDLDDLCSNYSALVSSVAPCVIVVMEVDAPTRVMVLRAQRDARTLHDYLTSDPVTSQILDVLQERPTSEWDRAQAWMERMEDF